MNTVSTNEFALHLRPSRLIGKQMKGSPTLAPGRAGRFAAIESREREHHDVAMKSRPSVRSNPPFHCGEKQKAVVGLPSFLLSSLSSVPFTRPSESDVAHEGHNQSAVGSNSEPFPREE